MSPVSGGSFHQIHGEDYGENYSNGYRQGVTMHYSKITDIENSLSILLDN
jgi:hypothetical protein